jgi:hypothetical protein
MTDLDRRTALALIGAGGAVAALPAGARAAAALPDKPWLYSPEQAEAEAWIMRLERDAEIKALQARIRTALAAGHRAQTLPSAAATLDNAIAEWTRSLIFAEAVKRPWDPVILWTTDDTSRTWLGHTLGGVGTSGDNPDAVYHMGIIEGGGRYELIGQFHPDSRPTQLLIEADAGDMTQPQKILGQTKHLDIVSNALMTDKSLVLAADGSFRITVGGEPDGPNHMAIPASGTVSIGARDMLADWNLRPVRMKLRRLDKVAAQPWGYDQVKALALQDLEGYIGFWAHFPDIWMGGLKPNTHAEPAPRPGGWGFVAGLNFHLGEGEGLLVTLSPGAAQYTGFQINDPWMIAPDARTRQVCLNKSQVTPNADGTVTYVIAKTDPGAANWLDTAGLDDGLAIMRWQQVPAEMTNAGLVRDFRVVKLSDLAAMPGLPRVTPGERRARIVARAAAYNTRVG